MIFTQSSLSVLVLSLLTGQKVEKVGKAFITCINEVPRLQITLTNTALESYLQLICIELTQGY